MNFVIYEFYITLKTVGGGVGPVKTQKSIKEKKNTALKL